MPVRTRSAADVHRALKAAIAAWEKAEHNAVLCFAEILNRKLYVELGYSSIHQYARLELKFSDTRTGDFVRLARRLAELPRLREAVENGAIGYTKAREIITVASPRTEAEWVAKAKTNSRAVLIEHVKNVRAKAAARRHLSDNPAQENLLPVAREASVEEVPVRVSLEMTPEQYARYEELVARLGFGRRVEILLNALAGTVADLNRNAQTGSEKTALRGVVPVQVIVHHCPRCDEAVIPTNRGELKITAEEFDRLKEDAQVYLDGGKNKATIPPKLRLQALARDRHSCAAPGCRHTHFLHVHHVTPRELGGTNKLENLVTLCSGCHRQHHHTSPATRRLLAPRK